MMKRQLLTKVPFIVGFTLFMGLLIGFNALPDDAQAQTPTETPTGVPTFTPVLTPTIMPTNTSLPGAATSTVTPTVTPSPSLAPTFTLTPTLMPTPTPTPTATFTPSPTPLPTATPTQTPSATPTSIPGATATSTPLPTPTPTWTAQPSCQDQAEPNDQPDESNMILVIDEPIESLTLDPQGDVDFFRLWGKSGSYYEVTTTTRNSLDTRLRVFDPAGSKIAENDDYEFGNPASKLRFRTAGEGWYIIAVDSRVPVNWGCRTYEISAVDVSPPTPQPTSTLRPHATAAPPTATPQPTSIPAEAMYDLYEPNPDFARAANIGVGQTLNLNFNPYPAGVRQIDYDFFRVFVKNGQRLEVKTAELASGLDTNLMLYRDNGETIAYNDDCTPGFLESCLTWLPDYTGVAYVLVGPVGTIPEAVGSGARAYTLSVTDLTGTEPDKKAAGSGSGASGSTSAGSSSSDESLPWRVTPLPPTSTPPPTATPLPQIVYREVSSAPPPPTSQPLQTIVVELSVYYDENDNRAPDISEGVSNVSVRVLDYQTNQLLGHVFTDQFGHARLMVAAVGQVRLSVPYLGYSEAVKAPGEAFTIRLAALQLPGLIP